MFFSCYLARLEMAHEMINCRIIFPFIEFAFFLRHVKFGDVKWWLLLVCFWLNLHHMLERSTFYRIIQK